MAEDRKRMTTNIKEIQYYALLEMGFYLKYPTQIQIKIIRCHFFFDIAIKQL